MALLGVVLVVGSVMAFVALIVIVFTRYSANPPSIQTRQRLAVLNIAFGAILLGLVPVGMLSATGFFWVGPAIQGPALLAMGWMQLRELRREKSSDA